MKDRDLDREPEKEEKEKPLPLVIEIMPGQAAEGLIDIYQPGTYEKKTLRSLCEESLERREWSIEERQIVEDIQRQLDGGRLISRGQMIDSICLEYAEPERTEAGEDYLYVPIRAIRPQEGGG